MSKTDLLVRNISHIDGYSNGIAKKSIKFLYQQINSDSFEICFEIWEDSFSKIHGLFDTQRIVDIKSIEETYGISLGQEKGLQKFIFCLETYYSIILRMIAFRAISSAKVDKELSSKIVSGEYFKTNEILNYDCNPVYDWFLYVDAIDNFFEPIFSAFNFSEIDAYNRDFIKSIFENIFDSKIRHSMGEVYTPDWLVDYVIENILNDDPNGSNKSYMDPTCGSGSFIRNIILRFSPVNPRIIEQVYGVDLNPVSVLAAKTNIILAAKSNLVIRDKPYIIPIFEGDIINNETKKIADPKGTLLNYVPKNTCLPEDDTVNVDGRVIVLPLDLSFEDFKKIYIAYCTDQASLVPLNLRPFYLELKKCDFNYREMNILLSKFALKSIKNVDYLIGNPPWVNWEYLPKEYRDKHVQVWQDYGLFDLKGINMTFIKEDISSLITYKVIDKYLGSGGTLGFVLKESLFKSSKQAEGFRKFQIKKDSIPIRVLKVYDLTRVRIFPGIVNRTVVAYIKKGLRNIYPVPYYVWQPKKKATIDPSLSMKEVLSNIEIYEQSAKPADLKNLNSGWITLDPHQISDAAKILGRSDYRARTGVFTGGANSVFWLKIIAENSNTIIIRNDTERAIKKVAETECEIEKTYVYPLLKGRDLGFWNYKYSGYILCPHTLETKINPISVDELKRTAPKTFEYVSKFKDFLRNRGGFAGWEKHILEKNFFAIQRIGDYTFKRYKVGWKYISKNFIVSVIDIANDQFLGEKIIIPNEKIISVGLDNKEEAYYLCGILSSDKYRSTIESYMVGTQIGPHILEKLKIDKFDQNNNLHLQISKLCEEGHASKDKAEYLSQINEIIENILNKD
jgi:methylase of polypeptide subunit release factors